LLLLLLLLMLLPLALLLLVLLLLVLLVLVLLHPVPLLLLLLLPLLLLLLLLHSKFETPHSRAPLHPHASRTPARTVATTRTAAAAAPRAERAERAEATRTRSELEQRRNRNEQQEEQEQEEEEREHPGAPLREQRHEQLVSARVARQRELAPSKGRHGALRHLDDSSGDPHHGGTAGALRQGAHHGCVTPPKFRAKPFIG